MFTFIIFLPNTVVSQRKLVIRNQTECRVFPLGTRKRRRDDGPDEHPGRRAVDHIARRALWKRCGCP